MPKYFCDYCDVYLTHDSMSVRKAHNSGRNHLRNVVDYYQQIGHEKAQSVIDSITNSYTEAGQQMPSVAGGMGQSGFPGGMQAPSGFPTGMPPFPPPGAFPGGSNGPPGPGGRGIPPFPFAPGPGGMPFPPPNGMPFPPPTPGSAGSPPSGMPFPPPGQGGMPFPPPNMQPHHFGGGMNGPPGGHSYDPRRESQGR